MLFSGSASGWAAGWGGWGASRICFVGYGIKVETSPLRCIDCTGYATSRLGDDSGRTLNSLRRLCGVCVGGGGGGGTLPLTRVSREDHPNFVSFLRVATTQISRNFRFATYCAQVGVEKDRVKAAKQ